MGDTSREGRDEEVMTATGATPEMVLAGLTWRKDLSLSLSASSLTMAKISEFFGIRSREYFLHTKALILCTSD